MMSVDMLSTERSPGETKLTTRHQRSRDSSPRSPFVERRSSRRLRSRRLRHQLRLPPSTRSLFLNSSRRERPLERLRWRPRPSEHALFHSHLETLLSADAFTLETQYNK